MAFEEILACTGMGNMANPIKIKGMTRHNLYEKFAVNGYTVGAEIGVFRGRNALDICRTVPNVKLYGIDHWPRKSSYKTMQKVLRRYINRGSFVIVPLDSLEAVRNFKDGSLDFVYIDANHHFNAVIQDLIHWSRKVRIGGIISGHDYYRRYKYDVMNAVNAYTYAHRISPWYITDKEERPGKECNNFFWEKQ